MTPEERSKRVYRITLLGSVVNLLLVAGKFVAGVAGNSAAMIADAAHSLSDFVSDLVVIACQRVSGRPADEDHDYGHGKYETLATAFIGALLFLVGVGLLYNGGMAIYTAIQGHPLPSPEPIALIAAIVSVASKEWLYQITVRTGREVNSQTMIANAWHHRSDALSSIGTTVGIGGALLLGPSWAVLDPLAAILVSLLILRVAFDMLRASVEELLEKSLTKEEEAFIIATILAETETSDPHSLRTRRIGHYCAIDVHFRVQGEMTVNEAHEITLRIERALRERFGQPTVITTHVEPIR